MRSVTIREAKARLSELVDRAVAHGESFVITKAGKPLAKVTPLTRGTAPVRRIGFLKGWATVPEDIKAFGRDESASPFGCND
jgi:prevent-host-death family protein